MLRIRPASDGDGESIAAIYNHYIATSVATFELDAVSPAEMRGRIDAVRGKGLPWLVAEGADGLSGYAYAGPWRVRPAYRHSVEATIYLDLRETGRGLGQHLYSALLQALDACDVHTVIGGIALPNDASVALHESLGFEKVAHFHEVGYKFERWVDVGYWQLGRRGQPRRPE